MNANNAVGRDRSKSTVRRHFAGTVVGRTASIIHLNSLGERSRLLGIVL